MAKPRLKRYQSGGKVKHYVTGGTAEDDSDEIKPQATPDAIETPSAPVSSTPPRTTPVVSGTRPTPMSGAQVAAARNVRAARTLPATNPATALRTPSPPFGSTGAPTGSVGSNQAVPGNRDNRFPVLPNTPEPRYTPLGHGPLEGSTQVQGGIKTPRGGFIGTGITPGVQKLITPRSDEPVTPTQPTGQTAIAGPNIRRPGFVYGGRVANNTMPKKVGMQRPMPFMHGGKVKMWQGGRVRKMQDGGKMGLRDQTIASRSLSASELAAPTKTLNTRPNERVVSDTGYGAHPVPHDVEFKRGGKVRKMQSGGSVDDRRDLLAQADDAFYGGGNAPRPTPTPTPRPGTKFLDKVKGVTKAIADRDAATGYRRGGRVRPVARAKSAPMSTPQPSAQMPMMPTAASAAVNGTDPNDQMPMRVGGRVRKMQDGGMVRVDEAARDTQNSFGIPPRHQFANGGKLPPDNVPAMLGKGEVVLNKNQQKRVAVKPGWQNGLNPKEKSAMSQMGLPRMRKQHAMTGKSVPRIFGGK